MKKYIAFILSLVMVLSLAACGNSQKAEPEGSAAEEENPVVEVDSGLFNVTVTIPADYIGEITQEELDQSVSEKGYKSATLNDDGSVTYVMTKAQHEEMMESVKENIDKAIAEMAASDEYSSILSVEPNDDYTDFTVTISGSELGLSDIMSAMAIYMYGGMYNSFNGTSVDNIHISYVDEAGNVIDEANSKDLEG